MREAIDVGSLWTAASESRSYESDSLERYVVQDGELGLTLAEAKRNHGL